MPRACFKSAVYAYFNGISREWVKETMNNIIASSRNIPIAEAKKIKSLKKTEVKAVMAELGEFETE